MLSNAFPIAVLKHTGFAVLLAFAPLASSDGSAADLRLRMDPTAARHAPTPTPKTRKQLFEEFLEWKRQQSR